MANWFQGRVGRDGITLKQARELVRISETTLFDGHALKRHGGEMSDWDLVERNIRIATAFNSDALLFETVCQAINDNKGMINGWLGQKSPDTLVFDQDMQKEIGHGLQKSAEIGPRFGPTGQLTVATIILRKEIPNPNKNPNPKDVRWWVVTAFPIP